MDENNTGNQEVQVEPMLIIDGVILPPPSKFDIIFNDLESEEAGRSLDGNLHRDVIGKNFRTIELEWATMKKQDLQHLLYATERDTFQVVYYDPMLGVRMKKTMYAGDRRVNMYDYTMDEDEYGNPCPLWLNISVTFMQVYNEDSNDGLEYDGIYNGE